MIHCRTKMTKTARCRVHSNLLASLNLLEIQTMNNPASQPERDPITHQFIGHAMKVHSLIGPGLLEEIYHQELVASLQRDGIERA
jgi:hypothetical protein